nr:beta-NGF-like family protein [Oriental turtle dovepox virus]
MLLLIILSIYITNIFINMIRILFTSVLIFSIYSHITINEDPKVFNEMLDDRVVIFRRSAPLDRTKEAIVMIILTDSNLIVNYY